MKKSFRAILSVVLCIMMIFGNVAIGGEKSEMLGVGASAVNEAEYNNRTAYQIRNDKNDSEDEFFDGVLGFVRKMFFSRISFDTDGGTQISNIYSFKFFGRISKPSDPVKEGFIFDGWEPEIPTRAPLKNLDIKAKWIKNRYSIKWIADGKIVKEETYGFGEKIKKLEAPEKEGYTFAGWYDVPDYMPSNNIEITALYDINSYCVKWIVDGFENICSYNFGDAIIKPSDPVKEGYTFSGWNGEIKSIMPATDLQYTAIFNVNSYNVILNANGGTFADGSNIKSFDVNYSKPLNLVAPSRRGYDFAGWDAIVPKAMPAEDLSFNATWTARTDTTYLVYIYVMGLDGKYGEPDIKCFSGKTGASVTYNPESMTGFSISSKSILATVISADDSDIIKVYYDRNLYNVSFVSGAETISSGYYYYGCQITAPRDPVKENYQFVGWKPQVVQTVSSDMRYEAQWKKTVLETYTSTFEEFENAVSELLEASFDDENFSAEEAKEDEFYMGRIVLKGSDYSGIDFKALNADEVIFGNDGTVVIQFPDSDSARKASEYISEISEIDYVEADAVVEVPTEVEVEKIPDSTSQNWGKAYIGADKYAYYLEKNNFNDMITVAVIDTGADSDHSYLKNRLLPSGHNSINAKSGFEDDNGHGTHVSGIIADCTSGLSNVKIMPIKALGNNGGSILSIVNAITYATDHNVDVINMSLESANGSYSVLIERAINNAIAKGIVVVVAAGNGAGKSHTPQNTRNVCPAYLTNSAIVVGAIDKTGNKGSFSNFGESVDVAAPGVSVFSSFINGEYRLMSGTSQAAPHVAAVAAMYKLSHPNYSPEQIEQFVKDYCNDLGEAGRDDYYGEGSPDMYSAIPDVTVSFNSNGGSTIYNKTTKNSQSVILPSVSKSYKVSLNANGGSVGTSSYTRNCSFNGWYTSSSLSGTAYAANSSYPVLNSQTLYAKWTNGTLGSIATPTRTGYTFDGWYTSASGGTRYTSSTAIESNITLYAHWNINKYTIYYSANGGLNAPNSQTKTYGTNLTLTTSVPTRSNYKFVGWNTNSSGTGKSFLPGATYSSEESVTLYAQWTQYTLSYNANGGSGTPSNQNGYGSTSVSGTIPTKSGYRFLGWSTSSSATSASYTSGSTLNLTSNITLYAVWGKRSLTLSSYSASENQLASATCTYGSGEPYCWRVLLPSATATNLDDLSGTTGWIITSYPAYSYISGSYLYMSQPGTYKLTYYYNGYSSETYTYTLSLYKTTSATNFIRSSASDTSTKLGSIPASQTVTITKVEHMGSYTGESGYAAWGYVTYGGVSGWIILWK